MSDHTTRPTFITLHPNAKDITGQHFGRLIALGPIGRSPHGHIVWLMQCDCGNTSAVMNINLWNGTTLSCGCLSRENTSRRSKTHGMTNTQLYSVRNGIIDRCTNPGCDSYADYGGRGITICDEWRHDFQAFYDHVSGLPHCGEKGYSLDRIDNDGNYEPGNVRFATQSEQNRNQRTNRLITYKGETKCLTEWALELQVGRGMLDCRLRAGWSIERAFTEPHRYDKHK